MEVSHKSRNPENRGLIQAVRRNAYSEVEAMVNNSDSTAIIMMCDSNGWTSLHHASYIGSLKILRFLVSKMTSRDAQEALSRQTWLGLDCLAVACTATLDNTEVIHFLLATSLDVREVNLTKVRLENAFIRICQGNKSMDSIKLLLTMGATINGYSLVEVLKYGKDFDLAQYLIKKAPSLQSDWEKWLVTYLVVAYVSFPKCVVPLLQTIPCVEETLARFFSFAAVTRGYANVNLPPEARLQIENTDLLNVTQDQINGDLCEYLEQAKITLDSNRNSNTCLEDICFSNVFKYFPELDCRIKISLQAIARHLLRSELNKKMGCWTAVNWIQNEFQPASLRPFLLYQNEEETFPYL